MDGVMSGDDTMRWDCYICEGGFYGFCDVERRVGSAGGFYLKVRLEWVMVVALWDGERDEIMQWRDG